MESSKLGVLRGLAGRFGGGGNWVTGTVLEAEEDEEARDVLGWKFGKNPSISSPKEEARLTGIGGPAAQNQSTMAPSAQASSGGP